MVWPGMSATDAVAAVPPPPSPRSPSPRRKSFLDGGVITEPFACGCSSWGTVRSVCRNSDSRNVFQGTSLPPFALP